LTTSENKIQLHNTMTRKNEPFIPLEPGKVKLYVCGPTVYSDPHIGNFRTFIVGDILRRWLDYRGYDVFHVMNITDIDDKTIRDSGKEGVSLNEFTQKYTHSFLRGLDLMNIRRATAYPLATAYIPDMVDFIKALQDKGIAYETEDGVYFEIKKFPDYGKLSGIDTEKVEKTERMTKDEYDKETVNDFALWKKSTPDEIKRGIVYDSPWGKGRPGWHIECSVMTRCLLGDTLDIHAGGEDLAFPHHENEIAQSESLTGKTFVRNWLHARHLMINGRKMSKSLGNFVSFDEVLAKYSAEAFRYFYLSVHYRRPLDYTEGAMENAKNSLEKLENTLDLIDDTLKGEDRKLDYSSEEQAFLDSIYTSRVSFEASMDDDLDTHGALDALHSISSSINKYIDGEPNKGVLLKASMIYKALLNSLGFFETRGGDTGEVTDKLLDILSEVREDLRSAKNYELSDKIRNALTKAGVSLVDTADGPRWKVN